eukprot:4614213-Amphidinium_carterae.1
MDVCTSSSTFGRADQAHLSGWQTSARDWTNLTGQDGSKDASTDQGPRARRGPCCGGWPCVWCSYIEC